MSGTPDPPFLFFVTNKKKMLNPKTLNPKPSDVGIFGTSFLGSLIRCCRVSSLSDPATKPQSPGPKEFRLFGRLPY